MINYKNLIKTLSCDLETYSSINLFKSGVYKYCESDDFEILLFAYSINGEAVQVVDLARGEKIPLEIISAIQDEKVIKWAFNAMFERICLSKYIGYPIGNYLSPTSWRCTMIWSAYLGRPLSLEGAGAVLGLDKQKLKEGKELIRYFCIPCKPTIKNEGRTRNYPTDDIEKWENFVKYNIRDVEVELGIKNILSKFPVPDFVWDEYHVDQIINDTGVLLDMEFVKNAIEIDAKSKTEITNKMINITELENPNSVVQMKNWLNENGLKVESLGKKEVKALIEKAPSHLQEILELRLQLSKSSIKKYQAMQNTVCADNRARGMFQFYGANRTGRFCLTGDHQVLTRTGWQRFDEWDSSAIACWNAASEAISFQEVEKVEFDYSGYMYTYFDSRIDQCSTPNHKMRVKKAYSDNWQDMTVEEMSETSPCIPMHGYRYHRGCANPTWIRVLIMTQADGHYLIDGAVRFRFKKIRKVERCKSLLRKADISFSTNYYERTKVYSIDIPARAVPLWLRQFRDKTFGFWLLDENPDIFFDELPYWDGYKPASNSIQYSTTNKQNADIVQALAHMSGRTAILKIRKRNLIKTPNWSDSYVLSIWLSPGNNHKIIVKPKIEKFEGKVYCAVTKTGYFLVRRGGKVWVTGNSGRNIQLQNLPQNKLEDLNEARELVKDKNTDALKLLYEDIPDTLSQLIRTAFIAGKNKRFIVADYSAIEARVIAWFANEKWRLDVFKNGGDIYCASASKMFKVPVEKHGINGHLRQKGKQAELACIAEGELVLTNKGLIPIEKVTTDEKLWDGESWINHKGVIYKGIKKVIEYEGLRATPDHEVWVEGKLKPIHFIEAATNGLHLIRSGIAKLPKNTTEKYRKITRVYDIRDAGRYHRFTVSNCLVHNCGYGGSVGALKAMGAIELGLKEEELKPLVDAWRVANPEIVKFWWAVDNAAKNAVKEKTSVTTYGIKFFYQSGILFIKLPSNRTLSYIKPRIGVNQFGGECITYEGIDSTKSWSRINTYGPKIVENIVQATSRDILCYAMKNLSKYKICMHIHDEVVIEAPKEITVKEIIEIMTITPPWAKGLLLNADAYETEFYKKD